MMANLSNLSVAQVSLEDMEPTGLYVFSLFEHPEIETRSLGDGLCQILVFASTEAAYSGFFESLPKLFEDVEGERKYLDEDELEALVDRASDEHFSEKVFPSYDREDVRRAIRYYAMTGVAPLFHAFDACDVKPLDFFAIAKRVVDDDMDATMRHSYIRSIWDDDDGGLLVDAFETSWIYDRYINAEVARILRPDLYAIGSVDVPSWELYTAPLEIFEFADAEGYEELKDEVFGANEDEDRVYHCEWCDFASPIRDAFHMCHIESLAKGGWNEPDNMMLVCQDCWADAMFEERFESLSSSHYSAQDLAFVVRDKKLGAKETAQLLAWIHDRESDMLQPNYKFNLKRLLLDVLDESYFIEDQSSSRSPSQFAKALRLESLYYLEGAPSTASLREILDSLGRKRRTEAVNEKINDALSTCKLVPFIGGEKCDIETVGLNTSIEFRVLRHGGNIDALIELLASGEYNQATINGIIARAFSLEPSAYTLAEDEEKKLALLARKRLSQKSGERKNDYGRCVRVRRDGIYELLFCYEHLVAAFSPLTQRMYLINHVGEPEYTWETSSRAVREFVYQTIGDYSVPAKNELPNQPYVREAELPMGVDIHEDVSWWLDILDNQD